MDENLFGANEGKRKGGMRFELLECKQVTKGKEGTEKGG